MPESQSGGDAVQRAGEAERGPIEYPTNHVVAVLDTPEQTSCAIDALLGSGFLESEIEIGRGTVEADRVEARTGRQGFQDWLIRLFQSVGLKNAETEMKDHYKEALYKLLRPPERSADYPLIEATYPARGKRR